MSDRYTIAPAAAAALGQATLLWPERSRLSDGLKGDDAHAARESWHNPCDRNGDYQPDGVVCAFDLTHDPVNGCDAHKLVRAAVARGDQRISEAISLDRIWTRARAAEGWRRYKPTDPNRNRHEKHAHVTVAWAHRNDTSPWWITATSDEELDMDEATLRRIIKEEINKAVGLVLRGDATHPDHLKAVRADLREIKGQHS